MGHIFDPEVLHEASKKGADLPYDDMFRTVREELTKVYPDHIAPEPQWLFTNTGGSMGCMALLHASLSETVAFFGSPVGTEGHTGRSRAEVWDFMLAGEMWCYSENEAERTVYKSSDAIYLSRGDAKGYKIPEFGWMLEYSRGPIPTRLAFGIANSFLTTMDIKNLTSSVVNYGRLVYKELRQGKF